MGNFWIVPLVHSVSELSWNELYVRMTVHLLKVNEGENQLDATSSDLLAISYSSICFGRLYAHRQERTACYCLRFPVLVVRDVCTSEHISLPDSPELQQLQPGQETIGSNTQFCPDDGRKGARNMLRNN